MTRKLCNPFVLGLIFTFCLLVINVIYALITGDVIGIRLSGGEVIMYMGFGLVKETIYPEMTSEELKTWEPSPEYNFDIISFLCTYIIICVILFIIHKRSKRKK